jgi:hypothetical protein
MRKLNDWVADLLADALSTMACFWIITSMVIVVLFWQRPTTLVGWITYISTAIFQASALPVLAFVSKKEGARQQTLLQETHDATMEEMTRITKMVEELQDTHREVRELVSQIHVKVGAQGVDVTVAETDNG